MVFRPDLVRRCYERMISPTIDADRLWQTILDMAEIGATSDGGSCRLALSPEDAAARALLLTWCEPIGLKFQQVAIGNMFLRREGTNAAGGVVAFGSHLDTVPTGGRFDGVFGVLAALEVIRTLHEAGVQTRASLELVNWTNEEGSRFKPAMMGSRVFAGDMELDAALATVDDNGVSVARALRESGQAGPLVPSAREWSCWLEAHIEQGPVLETAGVDIGVVVGTVHTRYFQLLITGEPSHVSPTTMDRRRDSLAAAAEVILAVEQLGKAAETRGRTSASWIQNFPNARGNVSNSTRLHCDVLHEDTERAKAMEADLRKAVRDIAARRRLQIEVDPYTAFGPIAFDPIALRTIAQQCAGSTVLHARYDHRRWPRLGASCGVVP
jgi:N-carbamoyl-L-amino-acid hydrolase